MLFAGEFGKLPHRRPGQGEVRYNRWSMLPPIPVSSPAEGSDVQHVKRASVDEPGIIRAIATDGVAVFLSLE
jgi:hypothetical protein